MIPYLFSSWCPGRTSAWRALTVIKTFLALAGSRFTPSRALSERRYRQSHGRAGRTGRVGRGLLLALAVYASASGGLCLGRQIV